jgi:hypothetical protein
LQIGIVAVFGVGIIVEADLRVQECVHTVAH